MTYDRLFFCATGFILALLSPCVGAQTRSEGTPVDAWGFHPACTAGTVCQVGVYACPEDKECVVYVEVKKSTNNICSFELYADDIDGVRKNFFYIDRYKDSKAPITWKLTSGVFKMDGGIKVPSYGLELTYSGDYTAVTWQNPSIVTSKLGPLILYNVRVKDCNDWGPGIINRG